MIRTDNWQKQTIEELQANLSSNVDVLAFALFGSAISNQKMDAASDLDFLLVVGDEQFSQFFPSVGWLESFGEIFAVQQFENDTHVTIRTCFFDFRRLDIVVTTPSKLGQLVSSKSNPLWKGIQILFSRDSEVTQCLAQTGQMPTPTLLSQIDFEKMVNDFWFKAMLAGYKVLRDDRLIASHLALDLVRDCYVLGMILRDQATGTNIHREGGEGNRLVDSWETPLTSYSADGILDSIESSSKHFDQLASQWSNKYRERQYPLMEWLQYIRNQLA